MAESNLQDMTSDIDDLFTMVLVDLIPEIAKELTEGGHIELEPQVLILVFSQGSMPVRLIDKIGINFKLLVCLNS